MREELSMAQQNMDFNEGYREQPLHSNEGSPDYTGSYYQAPPQKVTSNKGSLGDRAFLGGRIAVAICSLAFLIPLSAITLSNSGLIAFGMVCLTVIVVNIVFNLRNWSN
jgi:hypothetical protein